MLTNRKRVVRLHLSERDYQRALFLAQQKGEDLDHYIQWLLHQHCWHPTTGRLQTTHDE